MDDYDHQCHQSSKVFASVATWTEELKFCFNWNWNNFLQRYCSIYRNLVFCFEIVLTYCEKNFLVIEKNFANLRLKANIFKFIEFKLMIALNNRDTKYIPIIEKIPSYFAQCAKIICHDRLAPHFWIWMEAEDATEIGTGTLAVQLMISWAHEMVGTSEPRVQGGTWEKIVPSPSKCLQKYKYKPFITFPVGF